MQDTAIAVVRLNNIDLDGVCDELDNCIDISCNSDQDDIDEGMIMMIMTTDEITKDTPTLIKMIDNLEKTKGT